MGVERRNMTLPAQTFESKAITRTLLMSQNVHHLPQDSLVFHELVAVVSR